MPALLACAVVLIAMPMAVGAAASALTARRHGVRWTGYGALLHYWSHAHHKNRRGCPAGTCYGLSLPGNSDQTTQFIAVQIAGGRVIGYSQAFPAGTLPEVVAKRQVLAFLPTDTKTMSAWVQHDSQGNTCLMWNVRSRKLGRWLAAKTIGDPRGEVGIELSHLPTGQAMQLSNSATRADGAIVSLAPMRRSNVC